MTMTGRERIGNILRHQPIDRIGLYEHFWGDTERQWIADGDLPVGVSLDDHFEFDIRLFWPCNMTADLDFVPVTIEENDETILRRDGNGALLRYHKQHDATPEHVDFTVKDRTAWEERIKPLLIPDRRRLNIEGYRQAKAAAAAANRFFMWSGLNVFELMHPVCGHENMLMGMAEDPDWVSDMANTYTQLIIDLQEILFTEVGEPDGIWYYEDMGFKERPFMSPAMYRDIIQPAHRKSIDYAHSRELPVVMHSCGFVEPLLPDMIASGIDALQVIEIKAGMDPIRIHRQYGSRLALIGGIDVRVLSTGNLRDIDVELEAKIPILKEGFGYVLHSDHSIPSSVPYATYRYFVEKALRLGTY